MIKVIAPPVDDLNGVILQAALESAGYLNIKLLARADNELEVHGDTSSGVPISEQSRDKIERIVSEHPVAVQAARAERTAREQERTARIERVRSARAKGAQRTPQETAALLDDLATLVLE